MIVNHSPVIRSNWLCFNSVIVLIGVVIVCWERLTIEAVQFTGMSLMSYLVSGIVYLVALIKPSRL